MKNIFRFIPFWWKHMGSDAQVLLVMVVILFSVTISILVAGMKGLLFLIGSCLLLAFLAAVIAAIVHICKVSARAWVAYKDMRDKDAQKIVNRLKGGY